MKKFLLSLAALLSFGFANADIVEDFSGFPTAAVSAGTATTTVTSSTTSIEYEVIGVRYYAEYTDNNTGKVTPPYLMFASKTQKSPKSFIQFELPIDCVEMVIKTGASASTKFTLNVYAGDEQIVSALSLNAQNKDFKVSIPEAYREAGTVYKLEAATTKYNGQFQTITYVAPSTEPTLEANVETATFAAPLNNNQTKNVVVSAQNITGDITVSSNSDAFEVPASVSVAEAANGVAITMVADVAGEHSGVITFSNGSVKAELPVSGFVAQQEGTEEDPLTVESVISMNSLNAGPFCVTGIIEGNCASSAKDGVLQTTTTLTATNIVLKDADNKLIAVALPSGSDARTKLNLVDNENITGETVVVKGKLETYFGAAGVKETEYVSGLSGIESVVAEDSNAPVEYFNLQGVRVDEPQNGLYIRRQGSTVTKVIVK